MVSGEMTRDRAAPIGGGACFQKGNNAMTHRMILSGVAIAALAAGPALAERGEDGQLNILYWQAPSTLNPYLSSGDKDTDAASLILEPLIAFNTEGEMVPRLAVEVPTVANGGVAEDLTSITWKLKEGLLWSDGTPVTAEDVKFTAEYCMNPEMGCAQLARFDGIAGLDVVDERRSAAHDGEPLADIAGPVGLSAYRIVQEALTNVRRHSPAKEASVVLRRLRGASGGVTLEVEVTDNGSPRGGSTGTGLGQLGMRERAVAAGGTLEIGPRVVGGYRVRARLPLP